MVLVPGVSAGLAAVAHVARHVLRGIARCDWHVSRNLRVGGCARPCRRAQEVPMQARRPSSAHSQQVALHARQMRFAPTESERLLWSALRGCRLGTHFKRQVPVGGRYIADFLAPARRLVVEVDGLYHSRRRQADARRDAVLRRLGYHVLRLDAELVERELGVAVARVREALCRVVG
jgi:very-short-patch-repair endonuclease